MARPNPGETFGVAFGVIFRYALDMAQDPLIDRIRSLGVTRDDIAQRLMDSPLAPNGKRLTSAALGMWFTRGAVPLMWQAAVCERLGDFRLDKPQRAAS